MSFLAASRLLPSLIFDDQLPRHVFLGKEVLQLQVDSETANGMADCIDKELEVPCPIEQQNSAFL